MMEVTNYHNDKVRRQDRLLDEAKATELLLRGEYGTLSMSCPDEGAYGIPVNYVWDGDQSLYVHCAPVGRKLQCMEKEPRVSFCVVGKTNVLSDKFTTEYESIVLQCTAHRGLSDAERMKALSLLLDKYSPHDKAVGMKYAEKSFHRTEIIRLQVTEWSGKCKRMMVE